MANEGNYWAIVCVIAFLAVCFIAAMLLAVWAIYGLGSADAATHEKMCSDACERLNGAQYYFNRTQGCDCYDMNGSVRSIEYNK